MKRRLTIEIHADDTHCGSCAHSTLVGYGMRCKLFDADLSPYMTRAPACLDAEKAARPWEVSENDDDPAPDHLRSPLYKAATEVAEAFPDDDTPCIERLRAAVNAADPPCHRPGLSIDASLLDAWSNGRAIDSQGYHLQRDDDSNELRRAVAWLLAGYPRHEVVR